MMKTKEQALQDLADYLDQVREELAALPPEELAARLAA